MKNIFKKTLRGIVQITKPATPKFEKPVTNIRTANQQIQELRDQLKEGSSIPRTDDSDQAVESQMTKVEAKSKSLGDIVQQAKAYLANAPKTVSKSYDVAPSVSALVADAMKIEALKQADSDQAEQYKQAMVKKLRTDPRYKNKLTLADMQNEKTMIARMALIDAQDAFATATKDANKRSPEAIAKEMFENNIRKTSEPIFFCPSEGYYLVRNVVGNLSRVFIKPDQSGMAIKVSGINSFVGLVHRTPGSTQGGNIATVGNQGGLDISEAEFLSIISNKPSFDELARTYYLKINRNVDVDMTKPVIPLW
jgi:hypothetical protein